MPPKGPKKHELAVQVAQGTGFSDPSKKNSRYVIGKQFATGGFGRIYTCKEEGNSKELAVKVEPSGNGPLFMEIHVFQRCMKKEMIEAYMKERKLSTVNLPWMIASGQFEYGGEKLRFMVMPKYETSLEAIREHNSGRLSSTDAWTIAGAMLNALQYLHHHKYVHADIKAANILLEKQKDLNTAVLVDFGLAKMIASSQEKPDKKKAHNGTAIFTSSDAHRGCNPSYRGDVEILAYNVIYWIAGQLPWQPVESNPDRVYAAKQSFYSNLQTELAPLVPSSTSAASIKDLFAAAIKTNFTDHIDFPSLQKSVQKALSSAKNEGEKKTSTKPASRVKAVAKKTNAKVESEEEEPEQKEEVVKKTKKTNEPMATTRRRLARKRPSTEDGEEEELEEKEGSLKENRGEVKQKKPRAKAAAAPSAVADAPSPSVKTAADKLRQNVPGLRNLPKGRRSIIVNQIAKKHVNSAKD